MGEKLCCNCRKGIFLKDEDMKCVNVNSERASVKSYDKACEYWQSM